MKVIKLLNLVFTFFIIFSASFVSAEEKTLTAVFPTWKPYGYVEDGKAMGFEIKTFAAVMKKMNVKVEFLHQPWKRCLHSVKNGLADVVISALKLKEREAYLHYPKEPISISRTALFSTTEQNIVFNGSFEALRDYNIGITSGFSYGRAFDACNFLKKDESTHTNAVVLKVLLGRNELGAGNMAVVRSIAKDHNASQRIRFLKPLLHSQKLYVGFSKAKGHKELTSAFSKKLAEFRKSDEYGDIFREYGME